MLGSIMAQMLGSVVCLGPTPVPLRSYAATRLYQVAKRHRELTVGPSFSVDALQQTMTEAICELDLGGPETSADLGNLLRRTV